MSTTLVAGGAVAPLSERHVSSRGRRASAAATGLRTDFLSSREIKGLRHRNVRAEGGSDAWRSCRAQLLVEAKPVEDLDIRIKRDELADDPVLKGSQIKGTRPLRVLVAGAGIGGLVFALAAKNRGLDVTVFERDLTAIRGEGQYRGPIQIQSNALAALEAIDADVAAEVKRHGCVTGDRINGLVDGLTGEWYIKFDTFTPAVERGLPVTRVISRMTLQQILATALGLDRIQNGATVVDFADHGSEVTVTLDDGSTHTGDLLVGADGIRSKVRTKLLGESQPTYSQYTCYTGIADFTPPDIDTVGYRVFLGHRKYFVSSDVGYGKMQWYAFYNEPAGGTDPPLGRKKRLLDLFGNWCDGVVDLILSTPEEVVLRRDIYDRIPILSWGKGRVALLGDSAHAMQPNMGQGGCMAIEDAFQLALELDEVLMDKAAADANVPTALKSYESKRVLRTAAIHGMARMAAIMASTYRPYFGEGLGPLEAWLLNLRIPHWGRVCGQFIVRFTMPPMLSWVLGGYQGSLVGRVPMCSLEEKANANIKKWMNDDEALLRAWGPDVRWYLLPAGEYMPQGQDTCTSSGKELIQLATESGSRTLIGSDAQLANEGVAAIIDHPEVSRRHAHISCENNAFYVVDLRSTNGTWITRVGGARVKVQPMRAERIHAGDTLHFGGLDKASFRLRCRKESETLPYAPAMEMVAA